MTSLRRILIGLAAGGLLILAVRWLFDWRVAHTPASIPFPAQAWTAYCPGGEWYDD